MTQRIALIDADVLRYEIGAKCEGSEEHGPLHFDRVAEMIYGTVSAIVRATESVGCVLYLTGGSNFRDEIAKAKPYKGNRKSTKPFHFQNITAYMYNQYEVREAEGLEADDLMAIDQTAGLAYINGGTDEYSLWPDECTTIICTRDKDLRMVKGWHYGWECGAQREFGPVFVEEMGELHLHKDEGKPAKIKGTGQRFFYSQLLTGDSVDNIPGLPRCGPVKAYELLEGCETVCEMFDVVQQAYHEKGYDDDYLLEQGRLLWMVTNLDEDERPVMWDFPNYSGPPR